MKSKTLIAIVFCAACLAAQLVLPRSVPADASVAPEITWRSRTALPQPLSDLTALVFAGQLITIGGQNPTAASGNPVADIYKNPIAADGRLGGWSTGGALPEARSGHSVLVHGDRVYVIGGRPAASQMPVNTVWRGLVAGDGTIGNWQSVSELPAALYNTGTVRHGDFLYVAGGWDGHNARSEVYVATVRADGSLTTWSGATPLPKPLYALTLTTANGYLYAIGGHDGSTPCAEVYRTQVNPSSGTLGAWQALATLPEARYRHATVLYGERLLVIGGRGPQGSAVPSVFAASVIPEGALAPWESALGLPQALERHAAVTTSVADCGEVIFALGGRRENQYQSGVVASGCATVSSAFLPLVAHEPPASSPTPTATAWGNAIRGRITQNSAGVAGVAVDLDFYDGNAWSTRMQTMTDADGAYRFASPSPLLAAQIYNVTYRNYESDDTRLAIRQSFAIRSYAGGEVDGGSFDIQNIYHQSPTSGSVVTLPATFCWTTRSVPNDQYYLVVQDPSGALPWQWHAAGGNNCYTLTALPAGYQFGVTYGWSIGVEVTAVDGYDWGLSYYYRRITFQAGGATATPTASPSPTRTPTRTRTVGPTNTPTRTPSPTLTQMPPVSPSPTHTPTRTVGPTNTQTRTPSPTLTQTPPASPTPTATQPANIIYGHITQNDVAAANILIDLQFYDGSSWSTQMQVYTDGNGDYRFTGVPVLGVGQRYGVAYSNHESNSSRLWRRQSFLINTYSGGTVHGGSFDIQNIYHNSPASGATVTLPATFCWTGRSDANDNYDLVIHDPNGALNWAWYSADANTCYTLTSLPSGYQFGVGYGWSIGVTDNPVDGYDWGLSYYYRPITFALSGAAAPEVETPSDRLWSSERPAARAGQTDSLRNHPVQTK